MFNPIKTNIDWGFLFGFFSVASILITSIYRIIRIGNKAISVKAAHMETLISKPNELENEVKIYLNNKEIYVLNKIQVYLKNVGIQTLNNEDFHVKPTIEFKGLSNILSINISSSSEYIKINTERSSESKIELLVDDFEPDTYIKVELTFETIDNTGNPAFEVCLKRQDKYSIDLSSFPIDIGSSYLSSSLSVLPTSIMIFFITLGLTYFIVKYGLGVDVNGQFSTAWILLFLTPALIFGISSAILFFKGIKKSFSGYLDIAKWYNKAHNNTDNVYRN